jgi:hypothetical protein
MRPLLARCALGLGRLHASVGRHEAAQECLAGAEQALRALGMRLWLPPAEMVAG